MGTPQLPLHAAERRVNAVLRASERRVNGEIVIRDAAGNLVGTVVQMQGAAHAAMVAALWCAAPELLEACEAVETIAGRLGCESPINRANCGACRNCKVRGVVRAAIAKARGNA